MSIKLRLDKLRALLKNSGYDGYIVPCNDEYMSEYTPPSSQRLKYITGFSGSNGLALVLPEIVLFFTDGRYIEQSKIQLDADLFIAHNQAVLSNFNWSNYITTDAKIAYDPKLFTRNRLDVFAQLNLVSCAKNLVDMIWEERPTLPNSTIYEYASKYTGMVREDKIRSCRKFIQDNGASALLIADPASVCWLLNIRASDVDFTPILLAYAIVTHDELYLFTDKGRFDSNLQLEHITILPESEIESVVQQLSGTIICDSNQITLFLQDLLKGKQIFYRNNPCMRWKACKNNIEIEHAKQGHITDAVAVCEMLSFIANNDLQQLSEYDLGLKLTNFRSQGKNYVSDSFPAICGFQANGAVIHYRAEQGNARKIAGSGLLLIDSGGQYLGATTDITRTVAIGEIKPEYKEYYTRVLKGHIALASVVFPKNRVCGGHLDVLARQYLWQVQQDYAHGTGHGVGNFLSVHEGPQNISLGNIGTVLEEGMILSNEPGYYVNGEYGIRIENLVFVKKISEDYLAFENLTLVPYAKNLIDFALLTSDEKQYLATYYQTIQDKVRPLLSPEAKKWLDDQF